MKSVARWSAIGGGALTRIAADPGISAWINEQVIAAAPGIVEKHRLSVGRFIERQVQILALAQADTGLVQTQDAVCESRLVCRQLGQRHLGQREDRVADVDALSAAPELARL